MPLIYKLQLCTGFCGMDSTDFFVFTETPTEEFLDEWGYSAMCDHCDSYGLESDEEHENAEYHWSLSSVAEANRYRRYELNEQGTDWK